MAILSPPVLSSEKSSQNIIVMQQKSIFALQEQINNIRSEIATINSGLQNVSKLIQTDSLSEKSRLLEEQRREKALSDSKMRIGKESDVEKNLDSVISKPIQSLEPRLTSTLNGVSNSLKLLFFGFLGKGIIEGIKNTANFVIKGFSNIKSFISKTLGVIGDTFSWMKKGFTGIANSIGNVISKVKGVILTLINSPFKAISDLFKRAQGSIGNTVSNIASSSGGFLDDILKSMGGAAKKVLPPALGGGLTYFIDTKMGETPARAATGAAGALAGGSVGAVLGAPFGPVGSFMGSVGLGMLGQTAAKKGFDFITGVGENIQGKSKPSTSSISTDSSKSSTVSTTLNNSFLSNYNLNMSSSDADSKIKVEPLLEKENKKEEEKPSNIQPKIESPPKSNQTIGSLPEPKPNVIMASTVTQNPNQSRQEPKFSTGTDVPLISSSNSDNFYVLYSQTNYNVVM